VPTGQLVLHPFNGLVYRTTWVRWYHKGKTSLDLNDAKGDGTTTVEMIVGGWVVYVFATLHISVSYRFSNISIYFPNT